MKPPAMLERRALAPATAIAFTLCGSLCQAQGYTDIAPAQSITFTVPGSPNYFDIATGVSFHDFDGDGQDDLTFGNRNGDLKFYRNVNGTLEALPSTVFGTGSTKAVLWADIDNDGDADLLLTAYTGTVRLFRNDGGGVLSNITAASGLLLATGKYWGASFGDYDRDGFLDLYVCNYIPQPEAFAYSKVNHLYHNNGNGTFTDVTIAAGVGNGMQASYQSAWMDADLDGWPDLYVINDFNGANAMYRNNHDGTFTDVGVTMGLAEAPEHCMSISVCDFDMDQDLDLFMSNTGIYPDVNNARQMLEVNNGDGTYTESSNALGIDLFEWGWGGLWVDHDNDGYQDLYVATHRYLSPPVDPVADRFYHNQAGTGFIEDPDLFDTSLIRKSHSVARGDINGDGYADIVVSGEDPFPPKLWLNAGGTAHYARIGVTGTISNRQGIGTWIRVYAGGKQHIHYTLCGENFLGQSSPYVHFGLAEANVIDSVEVEYLSGHVDRYYDLPVDSLYRFTEGETFSAVIHSANGLLACEPDTILLDAGPGSEYLWSDGRSTRSIPVFASGSYQVTVTTEHGIFAESAPVDVVVGPAPLIIAYTENPACAGEATGSIALQNLANIPAQTVTWGPDGSGPDLSGLLAGTYIYTFNDANDCTATGSVELTAPDELFVLTFPEAEVQGDDGSMTWTIFGGTPPYVATIDGEQAQGTSAGELSAGSHQLEVTDASGCSYHTAVVIESPVGLVEVDRDPITVYPNPVHDLLHVNVYMTVKKWSIIDASGKTVLTGGTMRNKQIAVDQLVPGVYSIELRSLDGVALRTSFVKAD